MLTKREIFAGGIHVCQVGSSGHLLLWVWRRVEKRGGCEELDLCCVFELTRCAVDLGSKIVCKKQKDDERSAQDSTPGIPRHGK